MYLPVTDCEVTFMSARGSYIHPGPGHLCPHRIGHATPKGGFMAARGSYITCLFGRFYVRTRIGPLGALSRVLLHPILSLGRQYATRRQHTHGWQY